MTENRRPLRETLPKHTSDLEKVQGQIRFMSARRGNVHLVSTQREMGRGASRVSYIVEDGTARPKFPDGSLGKSQRIILTVIENGEETIVRPGRSGNVNAENGTITLARLKEMAANDEQLTINIDKAVEARRKQIERSGSPKKRK